MEFLTTPLYKFYNSRADHFEEAMNYLADGKIWFSGIKYLNDPWEGVAPLEERIPRLLELAVENTRYTGEQAINIIEAPQKALEWIRRKGIFCCSSMVAGNDPRHNKLLWSHYGNGGRGICVEFRPLSISSSTDSPNKIIHGDKIQYQQDIKPIGDATLNFLFPNGDGLNETKEIFDLALFQKPECWIYEDEYRYISDAVGYVSLTSCPVSAIYFGPRVDDGVVLIVRNVFANYVDVKFFNTSLDGYELKITD